MRPPPPSDHEGIADFERSEVYRLSSPENSHTLITMSTRRTRLAAVLGDVVGSRTAPDRPALQRALRTALSVAGDRVPSVQPLTPTIGDEFQGLFASPGPALEATLLVRLSLSGVADVRFGVGWGTLRIRDESAGPFEQDGPAWWAARAAIEQVGRDQRSRERPRGLRTGFAEAAEERPPGPGTRAELVAAMLVCRDELVARLRPRDARLLLGLLADRSPSELAAEEGITQSAVSQRAIDKGLYALRDASRSLSEVEWA
jgi:hypothetical protein